MAVKKERSVEGASFQKISRARLVQVDEGRYVALGAIATVLVDAGGIKIQTFTGENIRVKDAYSKAVYKALDVAPVKKPSPPKE